MSVLTDLRKAANHPLLLRNLFSDSRLKEMADLLVQVRGKKQQRVGML